MISLVSEHLKEAQFIKLIPVRKEPTKREGAKKGEDKRELLNYTQACDVRAQGFNVGLIAGNKLNPSPEAQEGEKIVLIDCDSPELAQYCDANLPETYTQETPSGGYHYVFRTLREVSNQGISWNRRHMGEIRADNQFIVVAPCSAYSKKIKAVGNYKIVKDLPLAYISDEIDDLLKEFGSRKKEGETKGLSPELLERVKADTQLFELFSKPIPEGERSEKEQSFADKLRARNFTKEEAFKIIANSKIGKLKEKPISYWELMWSKACDFVTSGKSEYMQSKTLMLIPALKDWSYFKKLKKNKSDLISDILPRGVLCLDYAEPKSCKSLIEIDKCICLASGRKWLDRFKTKKSACLYLDLENSEQIIKERLENLRRFHKIKKQDTPFYYLTRGDKIDLLNPGFVRLLEKIIKEKEIKYIVIDTLPKAAFYDSNAERDVNLLYTNFFMPILEKYKVSITFLLHTGKSKKSFIGSQAYLGIVDNSFCIEKRSEEVFQDGHKVIKVFLTSDNRGENHEFGIEFHLSKEEFQLKYLDYEAKPIKRGQKGNPLFVEIAKSIKELLQDGEKQQRFEIIASLSSYNEATIKKALSMVIISVALVLVLVLLLYLACLLVWVSCFHLLEIIFSKLMITISRTMRNAPTTT